MEEIIRDVAEKLGIDEETAQSVVGTLMSFVRDAADEEDANELFNQLPEAQELVEREAGDGEGGGGLMGMLGGMLGGSMGAAMAALSKLQEQGLDMGQIGEAGKTVFYHLNDKLDSDLVQRILSQLADKVPGLDRFMGKE